MSSRASLPSKVLNSLYSGKGAKIRNSTYSGTYSYLEIRTFPSIKINCVHFQEQKQFDCSISPLNLLIINQKRNLTKTFHNCSRQCYCYIFSGTQEREREKNSRRLRSQRDASVRAFIRQSKHSTPGLFKSSPEAHAFHSHKFECHR